MKLRLLALIVGLGLVGCDDATEADRVGVAAQCTSTADCPTYTLPDSGTTNLTCLTQFKGGYCGLQGCVSSLECPNGSICVHHTDGNNYCFRACVDRSECNANRSATDAANCSANFTWAVPAEDNGIKACIPPSGT